MSSESPSINDVIVTEAGGEWPTKSGGTLNVLYKLNWNIVERFLRYDDTELQNIPVDIRGLRSYRVKNIPKGVIGANEWHKVRNEIVFVLKGKMKWTCTDIYGDSKEFILDGTQAIFTPHHILHTYEGLEEDSTISVLANTLFDANNPATFDSYSSEEFEDLKSAPLGNS